MSRPRRSRTDIFEDFQELSSSVRMLSGIVQNSGMEVSEEELQEWIDVLNSRLNKLNSLREDVVRFYYD